MSSRPLRVGVTLPQFTAHASRLGDAVQAAEDLGFDSAWLFDHLWPLGGRKENPVLECWATLAWAGERTTRISVGTLVTRSSLRPPALLAQMSATVAGIAPGRLIMGVGSGDVLSRAEDEAFGIPHLTGGARIARLESAVEALAAAGLPAGARLWIGGRSQEVLRMAARHADGFNIWGGSPERFRRAGRLVAEVAEGRPVEPSWAVSVLLAGSEAEARARLGERDPEEFVAGTPEGVARRLGEFVDAGARHLVLRLPEAGVEAFERLAGVVAALRAPRM